MLIGSDRICNLYADWNCKQSGYNRHSFGHIREYTYRNMCLLRLGFYDLYNKRTLRGTMEETTTVTDNFSLEEFINHVKVSGILTEEGREYIDVRDVRLIIEMIKNPK